MLIHNLTEALILAKQNNLLCINDIYDIINHKPRKIIFAGSPERILADLDSLNLNPISVAGDKQSRPLDSYTACRSLNFEEAEKYLQELQDETGDDIDALQRLAGVDGGKEKLFQISFLIKLTFEYDIDFASFRQLAHLAGYSFHMNTGYPPYFFLQYALHKGVGYEEYRDGLLDIAVIKTLLENDILRLNHIEKFYFNQNIILDYLNKNREKYKTTFTLALKDRDFQADFIRYFFDAVYINGELNYERTVKLSPEELP